jgi:hypothetical protein
VSKGEKKGRKCGLLLSTLGARGCEGAWWRCERWLIGLQGAVPQNALLRVTGFCPAAWFRMTRFGMCLALLVE